MPLMDVPSVVVHLRLRPGEAVAGASLGPQGTPLRYAVNGPVVRVEMPPLRMYAAAAISLRRVALPSPGRSAARGRGTVG
jgi:hypothetical protein